jgi:hypothetical protein
MERKALFHRAEQRQHTGKIGADLQRHGQQGGKAVIILRGGDAQPLLQLGQRRRRQHRRRDDRPHHGRPP